jgi:hypothetical protein
MTTAEHEYLTEHLPYELKMLRYTSLTIPCADRARSTLIFQGRHLRLQRFGRNNLRQAPPQSEREQFSGVHPPGGAGAPSFFWREWASAHPDASGSYRRGEPAR